MHDLTPHLTQSPEATDLSLVKERYYQLFGRYFLIIVLIALSAGIRVLQIIPNVAPISAIALLGGATLTMPWSLLVPLAAMLVSDLVIGFDELGITLAVYGSFVATVLMGQWLKNNPNPWRILGSSLASSILFYLVTNAAVWKFSNMYPQTFDGLVLSYVYAIPFFRLTLLGDMVYTFSLFLAVQYVPVIARTLAKKIQLTFPSRGATIISRD